MSEVTMSEVAMSEIAMSEVAMSEVTMSEVTIWLPEVYIYSLIPMFLNFSNSYIIILFIG